DDTIEIKSFDIVKAQKQMFEIGSDGNKYLYSYACQNNTAECYKIFVEDGELSWVNNFNEKKLRVRDDRVLTDYSTHLIPKAIGYSAGLIKLFLQEAQNEEVAKLPSARIGLRGYGDSVFGFVISAGGEMLDYLKSKFNPATQTVVSATQENLNEVIFEAEKEAENDNTADGIASLPRTGVAPRNDIRERSVDEVRPRAVEDQDDRQPTEILKQVQDDNVSQFSSTYSGGGSSSISPSSAIDTVSSTSQHTPPPPPNLDQFFNGIIFTTTTEFNIYGTCSAQTTKIISDPQIAEEHTAPSGTIWNYFAPLLPGHNYFSFISMDAESATSTSSSVAHIVRDNKPPAIPSINIQDQTSPTSTNLQIILASSDDFSPFIFFDLYFTSFVPTSSPSTTYIWQPLAANTTTATFNLSTTRGQSYLFRSRAWDILNNTSPWSDELNSSTPINIDWSKEVVINEIAWAGTFADNVGKYDEWLELYNNTDQEINLKDWKIIVSDRSITFATNTYISARGYYLMERTDDSAVQNISADYIFTLASGLKNSGELLQLVNPEGEIIDEIDCSEGWFAGNTTSSESYPTMARVNSLAPGNDKNNWRTSRGPWLTAMVYTNGRLIFGSPREFNKEMKILSGTQIENELILDKNDGPYFLDNYTLPANSILRLDSGTEIYFPAYGYFYVNGNLISEGTEAEPVVFSPVPSTTMWANIVFNNTTATFAHTKFWRGNMEQVVQNDGALYAVSSTITLNHVSIWNSRKPGKNINSLNSILTVKNSSIGADVKNSNPNVNTVGIYAKGGEIDLDNVLFTNLNIGVDGGSVDDNFPELTINNMPEENFINIDYPWQPSNWLDLIALPEAPVVPVENQLIEPQDEIVASSSEQIFEPESTSSLQISA
ncbi:lamin tail domain-containing protein, partial [Patescibacteria group bacterium]|nr:lamin tail domain-containing protein [Patescibacteria group bacterium]